MNKWERDPQIQVDFAVHALEETADTLHDMAKHPATAPFIEKERERMLKAMHTLGRTLFPREMQIAEANTVYHDTQQ